MMNRHKLSEGERRRRALKPPREPREGLRFGGKLSAKEQEEWDFYMEMRRASRKKNPLPKATRPKIMKERNARPVKPQTETERFAKDVMETMPKKKNK